MKDCYRSKTSPMRYLPMISLVLTLFLELPVLSVAQQTYKIDKVVLDAGHGGKDPGCHGNETREKEVALAIVLNWVKKSRPTILT